MSPISRGPAPRLASSWHINKVSIYLSIYLAYGAFFHLLILLDYWMKFLRARYPWSNLFVLTGKWSLQHIIRSEEKGAIWFRTRSGRRPYGWDKYCICSTIFKFGCDVYKNEKKNVQSENEKLTCKACKSIVFLARYANLWPCCCHGC